jgi:hypothetical protein
LWGFGSWASHWARRMRGSQWWQYILFSARGKARGVTACNFLHVMGHNEQDIMNLSQGTIYNECVAVNKIYECVSVNNKSVVCLNK